MTPARWPREDALRERLLHLDRMAGSLADCRIADLPRVLRPGDLLVVNDAATLPASLRGHALSGAAVEVRLVDELPGGSFRGVLFGAGDWRTPTEHRPPPPSLPPGSRLSFGELSAQVERHSAVSPRLVELRFDHAGAALWSRLYRVGRPVQYAYTERPLHLWHVQVAYASRPWAAEMPSAGRPLRWELILSLRQRGIGVAAVTHAAGLSSSGDPVLDAALPLRERYEIPAPTASAVSRARSARTRVIAVGTTVVRALESAAALHGGRLVAGTGETDLIIGPGYRPLVVDGLLTGVHETTASHYALLRAFASDDLLGRASSHSEQAGYLSHEFGDSWLVL